MHLNQQMDYCGNWKYTIKTLGEPRVSATYLEEKFREYNSLYFKNELKQCTIKFDTLALHGYLGLYYSKKNAMIRYGIENPVILIDINTTYSHDILLRNLLIHEMIHMYVDEVLHLSKEEPSHGNTFQRIRRELNKSYNLRIDDEKIYSDLQSLDFTI